MFKMLKGLYLYKRKIVNNKDLIILYNNLNLIKLINNILY